MNTKQHAVVASVALVVASGAVALGAPTIDFELYDDLSALENGRNLDSVAGLYEGGLFTLDSSNDRAAIFDSSDPGPNDGGSDEDLLVNKGNILIIQNDAFLGITGGIYDTPNDEEDGGWVQFDFTQPGGAYLDTITLVDINGGAQTDVVLTDINGFTRAYDVPAMWTFDVNVDGPDGFGVLDLRSLAAQPGEGTGGDATVSQDLGFDEERVVSLYIDFQGSGGLDDLVFVPAPSAAALLGALGLTGMRRRR